MCVCMWEGGRKGRGSKHDAGSEWGLWDVRAHVCKKACDEHRLKHLWPANDCSACLHEQSSHVPGLCVDILARGCAVSGHGAIGLIAAHGVTWAHRCARSPWCMPA